MRSRRTLIVLTLAIVFFVFCAVLWQLFIRPLDAEEELWSNEPFGTGQIVRAAPLAPFLAAGLAIYFGFGRHSWSPHSIPHAVVAGLIPAIVLGVVAVSVRDEHSVQQQAVAEFDMYATRFPESRLSVADVFEQVGTRVVACAREAPSKESATRGQILFCLEIDTDRPRREGVIGGFRHSDYGESTAFSEPFNCLGRSEICEPKQPP
jgi:hypothetical protein